MAWRRTAITGTIVDLSSNVFHGIHLRGISQGELINLISNMCSNITF